MAKRAPPPPPPPRPTIDPEIVRLFKCQTGAMLTASEGMAQLATVILQGVRDDNAFKRGEAAAKFERAAALIRGEIFTHQPNPEPAAAPPPPVPAVITDPLPPLPPVAAKPASRKVKHPAGKPLPLPAHLRKNKTITKKEAK